MRIIGGEFKSRLISMPKGVDMRPTQDKVRGAVFNILGDITGKRVLELFAGSGAFGIEAISRGAGHAAFVDNNFRCIEAIKENLGSLKIDNNRYDLIKADALKVFPKLLGQGEKFDIIFMDPPYYRELAKKCLINADAYDILAPIGLIVVEHFKKDILPTGFRTFILSQERRYGDTVITIFRREYAKSQDSGLSGDV
ncbi:MAG: 16S rRNA (guanine(966)-N(2))-methyltransferase RsmD [Candidatus Omnitrophica bacterium]|nr:16S rRNA (guanine(966)-N(2))-methyltransferase RsmD [Candidatus Omnitrophota bacterium]